MQLFSISHEYKQENVSKCKTVVKYTEGLPGVWGEQGEFCSGNMGTKQENHKEQGNTKYIGEQSLFPGKNTNSIMT